MRWGRSLKPGDKVTLKTVPPIPAVVKAVRPWRERTQLRLVVAGTDLSEMSLGQRLVASAWRRLPPRSIPPCCRRPGAAAHPEERIEWFLSSIYCTCRCQGRRLHRPLLFPGECNPNGCAMPGRRLASLIDQGLNDKQIFEALIKEHGPDLLRPHLLP